MKKTPILALLFAIIGIILFIFFVTTENGKISDLAFIYGFLSFCLSVILLPTQKLPYAKTYKVLEYLRNI